MANITGLQPDIQFCPVCKGKLRNVPRNEIKSHAYTKKDGSVSEFTHTYECLECNIRFEINQAC